MWNSSLLAKGSQPRRFSPEASKNNCIRSLVIAYDVVDTVERERERNRQESLVRDTNSTTDGEEKTGVLRTRKPGERSSTARVAPWRVRGIAER